MRWENCSTMGANSCGTHAFKIIPKGYLDIGMLHDRASLIPALNRIYIRSFLTLKRFSNFMKNSLRVLVRDDR